MPDVKTMRPLMQICSARYKARYSVCVSSRLFAFFILCCYPFLLFAAQSEQPASTGNTFPLYGYLYLGDNAGESSTGSLQSINYISSPLEWGVGLGRYYGDRLSVEGALEYWGERYERMGTVIPGTENNVIQAGGLAFSATALGHVHRNDWHAYAGVGAGYYLTGILVTEPGSGLLTTEGAPSEKWLPGLHLSVGVDYRVNESHKLGIEIKKRRLNADFGAYTDGNVDLGGTFLLFVYRYDPR